MVPELARHVTPAKELDAIHRLKDRLHAQFPSVLQATVDEVVETHYRKLDANPIRGYVPLLVEHAAKADLLATPTS